MKYNCSVKVERCYNMSGKDSYKAIVRSGGLFKVDKDFNYSDKLFDETEEFESEIEALCSAVNIIKNHMLRGDSGLTAKNLHNKQKDME